MTLWQADFYRRPGRDVTGNSRWELLVVTAEGELVVLADCAQAEVTAEWARAQLQSQVVAHSPERLQVFRPQCLNLLEAACQPLGVAVEPTRFTPALKQILRQRAVMYGDHVSNGDAVDVLRVESPPPLPLPESLWGDRWRFGAIAATDFDLAFAHKPIPIRVEPEELRPVHLGLASTIPIPGVIIDGGRVSMRLAQWLNRVRPAWLTYIPGEPDGLLLEAGLSDRYILATFDDAEAIASARTFRERQHAAKGLHFLLVQPDDSGVTYSGLWLLQSDSSSY